MLICMLILHHGLHLWGKGGISLHNLIGSPDETLEGAAGQGTDTLLLL